MASNLPPGCSESDIPGNRPEDLEWDQLWDEMADWGLSPDEIRGAVMNEKRVAGIEKALRVLYDLHRCKGSTGGDPCEVCAMHEALKR